MFIKSYRETFAAIGVKLGKEDGCSAKEIERAEKHLGTTIPLSLREYFLLSGREERVNQCFECLLPPEKWRIDSDYLVFMEENQCVVVWGTPVAHERKKDAPVFQGVVGDGDDMTEWYPEQDSCHVFLNVTIAWQAAFGGAATCCEMGYVDEKAARKALDKNWQFMGEVNRVWAYKQDDAVVWLNKWEEPEEQRCGIPPWRVFAGAATTAAFERIKKSLPAKWQHASD